MTGRAGSKQRSKKDRVTLLARSIAGTQVKGLIPGPKEPPLSINPYITPLVSELMELWEGVQVEVRPGHSVNLRFAVAGVGCDLPAGRKLCVFLSYTLL